MKELEKFSDSELSQELLRREGLNFKFRVGDKVHFKSDGRLVYGKISNRYPLYSVIEFSSPAEYYFNIPEFKLHHS